MQGSRPIVLGLLMSVVAPAAFSSQGAQAQTLTENHLAAFEYRSIGPTRQSGRFIDIAVPSGQSKTFYIATGSGHLWKTDNHGQSFDVLFENEGIYSIGAIAVSASDPDVLYLGSGEANNSRSTYWGDGVYKSTDAGESWTNVGLGESHHIGRVVVHPFDPDIVYVAALGHLYSDNEERGLYRSENGGGTWDKVLGPMVEGKHIGVVDVVMDPSNPDVLYAATFDKVRLPFTYDLAGPGSRIYKTTDGGDNWEMLTNGLPSGMLGRIGIDVADSDPRIVYATIENANKEGMSDADRYQELLNHQSSSGMIGGEVYRSDDAGASWRKVNADDQPVGGNPAYYYGQIIVDPNDADVAYVPSVSTWKTEDGGASWQARGLGFGGDDHALWINPEDSDHMILGYDHGLGVTFDGGENWYHPDFQSLAQFYAIGLDNSYPYRIAGGLQDNGSHMSYHTNPAGGPIYFEAWDRVGGGDGMYNVFDSCTNRYLYNESQFGPISRLDLETGERKSIRYDDPDLRWNWNAPIMQSPHGCDVIYHAANRLLRSDNRGESWELISPDLTKADPATLTTGKGGDGNIQYATITTIDESPLVGGVIWVGTDDGNVQVTRDGGDSWTRVDTNIPIANNPGFWVSRVEASHHDPGVAYVSMTGMRRDEFRPMVFRTADYGATWTSIVANLPAIGPVNVVREHPENPNLLFVGTDFEVFASIDTGASWTSMKNNMPTNPVQDMQIHARDDDLVVATHGRGIYVADIGGLSELTPQVMASDAWFFEPEDEVRWMATDFTNYASSNFAGESEAAEVSLRYYIGAGTSGDVTFTVYQGNVAIAEIEGRGTPGLHEVAWRMDKRRERSAAEQAQMRARSEQFGRPAREDQIRFVSEDAPIGDYRIVMSAGGREIERSVSILRDEWWRERR